MPYKDPLKQREAMKPINKKWRNKNKPKLNKSNNRWRKSHKKELQDYEKKRSTKERLAYKIKNVKAKMKKIRIAVIEYFGGRCTCCGESTYAFLTISHINNDGNKHRKEVSNDTLLRQLFKNNFKSEYEITIECWNCNCGKRVNNGICPHKVML